VCHICQYECLLWPIFYSISKIPGTTPLLQIKHEPFAFDPPPKACSVLFILPKSF
jgi:hypothetical protein